jgi:carbon-monoxide dehydrogenase large subunit
MTVRGLTHAAFVRSPHPHADIVSIDAQAARAAPGVVEIFSGPELVGRLPSIPCAAADDVPARYPLTGDRVRYTGEPLVMVVARSARAALDAAELVEVEYRTLPSVSDPWAALEETAPLVHPERGSNHAGEIRRVVGDPEQAFARADLVVKRRLAIQRVAASPLEPRAILAEPDPADGSLTVFLSCQSPHTIRTWFSEIFEMDESQLRIVAPDVGGGFGSKLDLYSDELAVAWAALRLGRPIKWTETRSENLSSSVHARDQIHLAELAVASDGRILAVRDHFVADLGAYFHFFTPVVPDLTVETITGNYDIPSIDMHLERAFTNKMSIEALRGSGRAEATYVLERLIDEAARELGIDPLEMRLRNLVQPDSLPYTTATGMRYDDGDYPALLRRSADLVGYQHFRAEQEAGRREGRYLGVGLATYNLLCGFSPSGHDWNPMRYFPGHESALIRVSPHGEVVLYSGLSPHGQGSDSALAQIVADALRLPYESVSVLHGDTAMIPYGGGTHGSRGAVVGGHAALQAAERVLEKAKIVAASLAEIAPEDVELVDGGFGIRGTGSKVVSWREVCEEAHFLKRSPRKFEPGLEATAFHDPPDVNFAFGANAAAVEVDVDTGLVRLLRFVSVDDCGVVINPRIVLGQIHGGIAQGIGQALYEEIVYDESGQIVTSNFTTYALPSAVEVPPITVELHETPSRTPLGVRGVGESGTLASTPAVVNAVADALAPFGVQLERTPLRPDVVWELLHPNDPDAR